MPRPPGALSRLRRARASLHLEAAPAAGSDAAVPVRVTLQALEPLQVRRGRLQLLLVETYFTRTVLDGFHERSSERVFQTLEILDGAAVHPGAPLDLVVGLHLPEDPPLPSEGRPVRVEWLARVKFDFLRRRAVRASLVLADLTTASGGAPQVDGTGFLPL